MKRLLVQLAAVSALALVPALAQQKVLSLEEALLLGRRNSRPLGIVEAKAAAAAARAAEAGAALLPAVKAEGSYRRQSDAGSFDVSLPFLPHPLTIAPSILDTYSARVAVQQPLFTGFRLLNASRAADRLAEAGKSDQRMEESDLRLTVASAYWSLYQAIQMKRFAAENEARLESYRDDTRRLVRAGAATRNDELKIEVQLGNARLLAIEARNDVRLAGMSLCMVIGLPLGTDVVPTSAPGAYASRTEGEPRAAAADSLVARALVRRSDLQALRLRVEAARAGLSASRGAWWPQIFLAAGYTYARPNLRYQPQRDEFNASWDIGVGVKMDLWNWNATSFQTEQAEASLRQAELTHDQMLDVVTLDVRRASLQIGRATEKNGVARTAITQAEENLRMTKDRYENGVATSTELLDASVALLQAQTSLSGAQVELALAGARLERALGNGFPAGEAEPSGESGDRP